jgi:hypothetical protein
MADILKSAAKFCRVDPSKMSDKSAARKDEAHITDVARGMPAYQETSHSYAVKALEHAQAVEERERRQEEERTARIDTPLTAPQPRSKLPIDFHDKLTAQLSGCSMSGQEDSGIAHAGPHEKGGGLKPCASNETWRTVFPDHEEETRIPNKTIRESPGQYLVVIANSSRRAFFKSGDPCARRVR